MEQALQKAELQTTQEIWHNQSLKAPFDQMAILWKKRLIHDISV